MVKEMNFEPETEKLVMDQKSFIYFPDGLPAFETVHDFVIVANQEEEPFLWLQSASLSGLAFVTIDPFLIASEYRPDIADADIKKLEISSEEEAFILSIVTIHPKGEGITANLVSPVVINTKKHIGKQVILQNHRDYSVHFRMD